MPAFWWVELGLIPLKGSAAVPLTLQIPGVIALSLPLSFFPLYLLPYPISLTFWKSEVFWQHSVGVL